MNSSLIETVINILIGALIGTASSIAVSRHYYNKADRTAQTAGTQIENILFLIIQQRFEEDLVLSYTPNKIELPAKKDHPHIIRFWYSTDNVQQGESILILFRVVDTGLDHDPNLLEITEMTSMLNFNAVRQGYGYYVCKVSFPEDSPIGQHRIDFKLVDRKQNVHSQTLKVNVVK